MYFVKWNSLGTRWLGDRSERSVYALRGRGTSATAAPECRKYAPCYLSRGRPYASLPRRRRADGDFLAPVTGGGPLIQPTTASTDSRGRLDRAAAAAAAARRHARSLWRRNFSTVRIRRTRFSSENYKKKKNVVQASTLFENCIFFFALIMQQPTIKIWGRVE